MTCLAVVPAALAYSWRWRSVISCGAQGPASSSTSLSSRSLSETIPITCPALSITGRAATCSRLSSATSSWKGVASRATTTPLVITPCTVRCMASSSRRLPIPSRVSTLPYCRAERCPRGGGRAVTGSRALVGRAVGPCPQPGRRSPWGELLGRAAELAGSGVRVLAVARRAPGVSERRRAGARLPLRRRGGSAMALGFVLAGSTVLVQNSQVSERSAQAGCEDRQVRGPRRAGEVAGEQIDHPLVGHRVDDPALHAASAGLEGGLPLSLRGRPGDLLQEADRVRFPDGEWDDHRSDPVAGGVGLALGAHGNRDHGAEAKSRRQLGTAGEQGPCASRDSGEHDVVHRCAMRMGHLPGAL